MKLFSLIIATTFFAVSAFGVSPVSRNINRQAVRKAPLRKDSASTSPLFRDAAKTRGGAVPGWAAYNGALDKKPILTKALTSLAGFAIGDFLAQVRTRAGIMFHFLFRLLIRLLLPHMHLGFSV